MAEYFYKDEETDVHSEIQMDLVRSKSTFCPNKGRNKTLDVNIEVLHQTTKNVTAKTTRQNLNKTENDALNELRNDNTIIIKEADKGGAVVVMNTLFYKTKLEEMLTDRTTYKELPTDIDNKTMRHIETFVKKHHNILTTREIRFLTQFENRHCNLYGLPKIHKSKTISDQLENNPTNYLMMEEPIDLTFRPIVAGPQCATSRLSELVDILLKPFTTTIPSYIRDSTDLLSKLPGNVEDGFQFISFDVTSLYTNITNELGLEALQFWLDEHPNLLNDRFSKDFVLEAAHIILTNNSFYFNGKHFLQCKGTAMGTKMAPSYATLTLGFLEARMYSNIQDLRGVSVASYVRNNWWRFLDDCLFLWHIDAQNFDFIFNIINNLHADIKFTRGENLDDSTPFLDVLLKVTNGHISTDIFYKKTDTHRYLPYNSCHPRHVKNNIPFSLARRIRVIVSEESVQDKRFTELSGFLLDRGYPKSLIQDSIRKAKLLKRENLLISHTREDTKKDSIVFVQTYNPHHPTLTQNIRQAIDNLNLDKDIRPAFVNKKIIKGFRQPPNLKQILTGAKFEERETENSGVFRCKNARCGVCDFIIENPTVTFKNRQKPFVVKSELTCNAKNVIYVLFCKGCNAEYIGQTTNFRQRVTVHRQQIRENNFMILASQHFHNCHPHEDPPFLAAPFFKTTKEKLDQYEKHFIEILKPELNVLL